MMFLPLPDVSTQIVFPPRTQLGTSATAFRVPRTLSAVMTAAGKGPHIMEGPDDRPADPSEKRDREEPGTKPMEVNHIEFVETADR